MLSRRGFLGGLMGLLALPFLPRAKRRELMLRGKHKDFVVRGEQWVHVNYPAGWDQLEAIDRSRFYTMKRSLRPSAVLGGEQA